MDLLGLGEGLKERAGTENLRWVGGRVLPLAGREEGSQHLAAFSRGREYKLSHSASSW